MTVEQFESFDDMARVMGEREDSANASLLDIQQDLRDDTEHTRYWIRPFPQAGVIIFGETYSFRDLCDSVVKYVPDLEANDESYDEMLDEVVWEVRASTESRQRGYLFGRAYSMLEPEGELGSTHVASVAPISREAFEEARTAGWRVLVPQDDNAGTPTLLAECLNLDNRVVRGY